MARLLEITLPEPRCPFHQSGWFGLWLTDRPSWDLIWPAGSRNFRSDLADTRDARRFNACS